MKKSSLVTDGNNPAQLSWAANSDANYYTSAGALGTNMLLTGTIAGGGSNWTASFAKLYTHTVFLLNFIFFFPARGF